MDIGKQGNRQQKFAPMQLTFGVVLAVWVFLHPTILKATDEWLRKHKFKHGFADMGILSRTQVQHLQHDMGDDGKGKAYVQIVHQCHGDLVHVPAGYMHQVCNEQLCLKMAFEDCKPARLLNYVLSWQHIASKYTKKSNSPDYMNVMRVVNKVCVEADYFQQSQAAK